MKKTIHTTAVVAILITCFAAIAWAESATKDEVIAKCEEAAKMVQEKGVVEAGKIIGDIEGPFVWKDSYVFLMDLDGKMIANPVNPELTEQDNLLRVADTEGKPLFFEYVRVAASKKQGWVDYMWPEPGDNIPVAKSSYIYQVSGTPYFVVASIYK